MVKNSIGGKNAKKISRSSTQENENRQLLYKEDEQCYGYVQKLLGDSRCSVLCDDNVERLCVIRGKMKKKIWIKLNDLVLVSLRDFEDKKADIIHKYKDEEKNILENNNHLDIFKKKNSMDQEEDNIIFDFNDI